MILGDNGSILRVVVTNSTVLTRTPEDQASQRQALETGLLVRVVVLLDYTEGGPDALPQLFPGITQEASAGAGSAVVDVWGSDEIHGESGDDAIYAGGGNDVVFADAGDDNVVGGWGHDWISGGTGVDVLHGDEAWALTAGAATKCQEPVRSLFANDVIFGGWDDDVIDGGWGDDALSGAEALAVSWAPDYAGGVLETGWNRPFNNGNLLGVDATGAFPLYNKEHPEKVITLNPDGTQVDIGWKKVRILPDPTTSTCKRHPKYRWVWTGPSDLVWFLTNDATDGRPIGKHSQCRPRIFTDGDDVIFGQDGNDWMVGGTGRDTLWGGAGADLLNGDDDPWTDGGLNKHSDKSKYYQDVLIGGDGHDRFIKNHGDKVVKGNGSMRPVEVPSGAFARWPLLRSAPKRVRSALADVPKVAGPQVMAVPFTDPLPAQLAAPVNGDATWSPTYLEVPALADLGTSGNAKSGQGWGSKSADDVDCDEGSRRPACLLRVTTLLVTVGTTVAIPVSIQIVDLVENLAGRHGSHGHSKAGRGKEVPLTRDDLAMVVVLAAGMSVLPDLPSAPAQAQAPGSSSGSGSPELTAAAWMPGPGEVAGWLGQAEPWADGRAPSFIELALLPWVTPVEIAVLVDIEELSDAGTGCSGKHGKSSYELEKSLWLGSVPGPSVVGLALNWPVPWVPAGLPDLPRPRLGTASFAQFAALPWWLVPVATTTAVYGLRDPWFGSDHDSPRHSRDQGHSRDAGRHGDSDDRYGRNPHRNGRQPILTATGLAAQFAVSWSTVSMLVDVDGKGSHGKGHGHDGRRFSGHGGLGSTPGAGVVQPGSGSVSPVPGSPVFLIFEDTFTGSIWDFALATQPDRTSGHRGRHYAVQPEPLASAGLALGSPWVQVGPWASVPWQRLVAVAAVSLLPLGHLPGAGGGPNGGPGAPGTAIAPQSWMLPALMPTILDTVFGVSQKHRGGHSRHGSHSDRRSGWPGWPASGFGPASGPGTEHWAPLFLLPVITVVLLDPVGCGRGDSHGRHHRHGGQVGSGGPAGGNRPGSGFALNDVNLVRLPGHGMAMPALFPPNSSLGVPVPSPRARAWVLPFVVALVFVQHGVGPAGHPDLRVKHHAKAHHAKAKHAAHQSKQAAKSKHHAKASSKSKHHAKASCKSKHHAKASCKSKHHIGARHHPETGQHLNGRHHGQRSGHWCHGWGCWGWLGSFWQGSYWPGYF